MQILGIILILFTIALGFLERQVEGVKAFDWHAMVIILVGSFAGVMAGSRKTDFFRMFSALKELLPAKNNYTKITQIQKGNLFEVRVGFEEIKEICLWLVYW